MKPDSDINAMRHLTPKMLHLLADHHPPSSSLTSTARVPPHTTASCSRGHQLLQSTGCACDPAHSDLKRQGQLVFPSGARRKCGGGIAETGEDQANGWIRQIKIFKDTLNKDRLWHITALAANAHMKSRTPPRIENDDTLVVGNLRVPVVHNLLYIGATPPPRHLTYSPDSNLSTVSDKIVIIGSASSIDVHNTPFGGRYGPEVVGMYIGNPIATIGSSPPFCRD